MAQWTSGQTNQGADDSDGQYDRQMRMAVESVSRKPTSVIAGLQMVDPEQCAARHTLL